MANYCSNSVRFIGSENSIEQIRQLFDDINKKQMRSNRYHMPDFVKGGMGYLQDIAVGLTG